MMIIVAASLLDNQSPLPAKATNLLIAVSRASASAEVKGTDMGADASAGAGAGAGVGAGVGVGADAGSDCKAVMVVLTVSCKS